MPSSTSSSVSQATRGPNGYFAPPYSVGTLQGNLRMTLLPVAIMALVSFLSTLGLSCLITYRLVSWRKHYRTYPGYNQYLLLIFNLILADCQQSIAFLISFHWIRKNGILAPTAACFIQGWLVQVGDVSSGIWVLSIAIHTWYSVVKGRQVEYVRFCCCLIGVWVFIILLAIIGPIAHPKNYFVSTGAWCWINQEYKNYRLSLLYFWILLSQFGTVVIYSYIFCLLRYRIKQVQPASRTASSEKISRAARFMVTYPIAYVALSLPLPAGRLAVWSGVKVSLTFYCVGATLMTTCGFADTILYTLTRRVLVREIGDDSTILSFNTADRAATTHTVLSGRDGAVIALGKRSKTKSGTHPWDSTENIWHIVKTESLEVQSDSLHEQRASTSSVEEDR
ncbi:G protein-coupled glucose receptor regulating Gpa2-domain-containing protein [Cadophora sp. MPI-SDFR-AT-0126]|nr:G protein-coupled glucose receptor regulating Gpa2-domain-containing protein [Leotiomycetes sp. MPI-SDFR-AT-0126]